MVDPRTAIARQFAANVARLQQAHRISSDELATRSGLGRAEIDSILAADTVAGTLDVYLLAGALEVEPAELIAGIRWIPDGSGGGKVETESGLGEADED